MNFLLMQENVKKCLNGADNRSRTYDLRITNALLYQLSYIGFPEEELRCKRVRKRTQLVNPSPFSR